MRVAVFCLISFFSVLIPLLSVRAQDTLRLTKAACEAKFLSENLLLLAEKLEIPKAEALVQQARLWPNPQFTLDQVNLWATPSQTGGNEVVPPLFGNFGRNRQFGAEIEQLILTARKRGKLIAVEQVKADQSLAYFEELLRNVKLELRKHLIELQHLQLRETTYQKQLEAVRQLLTAYQRQVQEGHIPRSEYVRLKSLELEILKSMNDLEQQKNESQSAIRQWANIPADRFLIVSEDGFRIPTAALPKVNFPEVMEEAKQNRPDLRASLLDHTLALKQMDYEKARRTPDLTIKGTYDRNGNAMLNFFGLGASIDLPVFDRNQGNIRRAGIVADQAQKVSDYQTRKVENEVSLAYRNLLSAYHIASRIEEGYEDALDNMLGAYTKNFSNRNLSMLEFLDFMNAYLDNKQTILETYKSVNERLQELNYAVGRDLL